MCNSKRVMSDRWNSKWRPPPSWIHYFSPFWSNGLYPRWQPSTSLQNFIHLRQSAAELLMFVQKFKMAPAAILNYNFVMVDHQRSPFVHLKFSFKFRVDQVCTFRDITIRKFCKFGLKCLFMPPKIIFCGVLTPKHYFLSSRLQKVKLMTSLCLRRHISVIVPDRRMVAMDHR